VDRVRSMNTVAVADDHIKRALSSMKRALSSIKRALSSIKRALSSIKRALFTLKRAVAAVGKGWRRLIGSPKLQINFHKRDTKCRALLRKMTYSDKGSYESSPPCRVFPISQSRIICLYYCLFHRALYLTKRAHLTKRALYNHYILSNYSYILLN